MPTYIQSKKRLFCQNYTLLSWVKKVYKMPFFSDFSRKCSHADLLSKKRPFFKKHDAFVPIFCQKNVNSLKNTVFICPFFRYNNEKPAAVMPIFCQKTSNLSKIHYIMGQKSQWEKINIILATIIRGADGEKIGEST